MWQKNFDHLLMLFYDIICNIIRFVFILLFEITIFNYATYYQTHIPNTWRRPTPAICDLRHGAFTISRNRRIFFHKFLCDCTRCSPFVRVDYDAKRATGATISMQMSWRATNTKPARIVVLLDRTAPQI